MLDMMPAPIEKTKKIRVCKETFIIIKDYFPGKSWNQRKKASSRVSVDSVCCHTLKEAKLGSDPAEHSEETAAIWSAIS